MKRLMQLILNNKMHQYKKEANEKHCTKWLRTYTRDGAKLYNMQRWGMLDKTTKNNNNKQHKLYPYPINIPTTTPARDFQKQFTVSFIPDFVY